MAKGNDVAAMEIDDQSSAASDQISNPKFSINGASLSFSMDCFVCLCVCVWMSLSYFRCEFRSAAAIEISSNAARIAPQ